MVRLTREFLFLWQPPLRSANCMERRSGTARTGKRLKDHGDTGILLGSKLKDGDKVVIIEDVTTSGKSIEETFPIIKAQANVEIQGLMVSLNRMEVGKGGQKSALEEIQELYGFKANAIVTMREVVEYLYGREYRGRVVIDNAIKAAIDAYYEQYGVK